MTLEEAARRVATEVGYGSYSSDRIDTAIEYKLMEAFNRFADLLSEEPDEDPR